MKGALIKELYAFKACRMYSLISRYAVVIILGGLLHSSFLNQVLLVSAFSAPLIYTSQDEKHGWKDFSKALPLSAAHRVGARYIICIAEILIAILIYSVLNKTRGTMSDITIINHAVQMFFIGVSAQGFILLFSYIQKKSLKSLLCVLSLIIATIEILQLEFDMLNICRGFRAIMAFEKWVVPMTVLCAIMLVYISYLLAVNYQTHKQDRNPKALRATVAAAVCFVAAAAGSTAVLAANGRLVPEPLTSIESVAESNEITFRHNPRCKSNLQQLSQAEMYAAARALFTGPDAQSENVGLPEKLEAAGFTVREDRDLLAEPGDLEGESKYGSLIFYFCPSSFYDFDFDLYSNCGAKYIPVTDDDDMKFEDEDFYIGMPENELIDLLEQKDMPIYEISDNGSNYTDIVNRCYTVYIVYENTAEKNVLFVTLSFDIAGGKLNRLTSGEMYETGNLGTYSENTDVQAVRDDMMTFVKAFSGETIAGTNMAEFGERLEELGLERTDSNVFNKYIFTSSGLPVSFNSTSAYPNDVSFMSIEGNTGDNTFDEMNENELIDLISLFETGMTDSRLVELIEKEELYPETVYETLDFTFTPEKVYKWYGFSILINNYNGTGTEECEIRVELFDGKISNLLLYMNGGLTDLERITNEQNDIDKAVSFLKAETNGVTELSALIKAFEKMYGMPINNVSAEDDMLLFEAISYDGRFCFSLTRQIPDTDSDEFIQIHMDVFYPYDQSMHKGLDCTEWGDRTQSDFFDAVLRSDIFMTVESDTIEEIEVYADET